MTYRDRREAKAERLRGWADKREARAATDLERSRSMLDAIPFGQPILVGHHSERGDRNYRDRAWNTMGRGIESAKMAESMRSRADNIEAAAARAIYSDDADALEQLTERITGLEAERDRIKAFNASCRKGAPDWSLLSEAEKKDLLRTAEVASYQVTDSQGRFKGYPSYHLTNLAGNIKRNRDRLAMLRADQLRADRCRDAGGLSVEPAGDGYVCVTFSEKPAREVLDALKGAGFFYRRGSWFGKADAIPAEVSP